jgi:ferric-dicitrate binding protein FerR (iron transport regulator)/outer membrane receptor protein involved in Fe transport
VNYERFNPVILYFCGLLFFGQFAFGQSVSQPATNDAVVLTVEGKVETSPAGVLNWIEAKINQLLHLRDRLRTGLRSRATVRLSDLTMLRVNQLTSLEIQPSSRAGKPSTLELKSGAAYFFSRERPAEMEFRTPVASAAIRGTEFNLAVAEDGTTVVTLIDGAVSLTNQLGAVDLVSGEQGTVEPGQAPKKTAVINTINIIQWCLYYPAIVDLDELALTNAEKQSLADSLAAYRSGDLLAALDLYPTNRVSVSDAEKTYLAQLLLAVGQVGQAEAELESIASPVADALREMIATVKNESWVSRPPELATEWLVQSYFLQARRDLNGARNAALKAIEKSPDFGFAWERLAEMEFSFGRTVEASAALEKSLAFSPRNAQALSLKGFLLAAQNQISAAQQSFDAAITVDGALGNAWLGRGLSRIYRGDRNGGLQDLQVAATLEPNRSLLRSYLGKAFAHAFDDGRAAKELKLAQGLDPNDPTSWLYLALLEQRENKITDAIHDLEQSKALNNNRELFRSRLLLDQDQAVRGANLAKIYQDNGMTDVSVNEASRSVTADYANSSAHLFLSDAYNELRDPTQFNLRYETVWYNELLLANALSPVGAGRLSQGLSQQEYSKLFSEQGFYLSSVTDVRSDGMLHQQASESGFFGDTAYSLDVNYHDNNGVRPNNELNDLEVHTTIKHQFTPQDTALLLVEYQDYHSGDNFQYYNQTNARPNYHFDEYQQPILVGIWRHEWSPGIQTLGMATRLSDEQQFSDKSAPQLLLIQDATGQTVTAATSPLDVNYKNNFTIYGGELNQIAQWDNVTLVAGGRFQTGTFNTQNQMNNPGALAPLFNSPPASGSVDGDFYRATGYGYLTVEPVENLWLTAGLAYDEVEYPSNFRAPPVSSGQKTTSQLGPKGGLVWSPTPRVTLRAFYAQSLGGVSLDESYRLEPTQLAGFPQAFRSLISESVVGSVAAPKYETYGLALDLKLTSRTYATIQGERLGTTVNRDIGVFTLESGLAPFVPTSTGEHLDYKEYNVAVSLNQLIGDQVVLGSSYQFIDAKLQDQLGDVPVSALATADQNLKSQLNHGAVYVLWNHPSGFFSRADVSWYGQQNSGYATPMPGDNFFQENLYVGYRFAHRRAELLLGLLNISGQDYHLNPLTVYGELPRKRVFEARLSFTF